MVKYLEELLKAKTTDTNNSILYNQWMFDKQLVGSSLQAILTYFPHYSLHDETYSITILNNIYRILGSDAIEGLSAIDIWLMLEAAYYHDIGMILSSDLIDKESHSFEFIDYIKTMQKDVCSSMHSHAIKFEIQGSVLLLRDRPFTIDVVDSFRFLIADFFRNKHGKRSGEITKDPENEIGLKVPRVIIPQRLFSLLAEICSTHTKDFESVFNLPYIEVGVFSEDAHPRFIAVLLRLGDLLDIDNNRFSDVFLHTINTIPLDSILHKEKHMAIRSFRCDHELVEITAKCYNYDVATIIQQWFDCLNSDYTNCILKWSQIAPENYGVVLPTLGKLVVDLEGYEFIDGKRKPSFSVDPVKALDLLSGVGLYKEPFHCINELLQNAVDSTLIKIWLDYPETDKDVPVDFRKNDQYRCYDIDMSIDRVTNESDSDEIVTWRIKVEDRGIGLSKSELTYLQQAGSSYKNKQRNSIIDGMPEWLKPSGVFGIGFQSIFSITNEVLLKTKSFLTDDILDLELISPRNNNSGDIRIKRIHSIYTVHHGAVVTFDLTVKTIPETMRISFDNSLTTRYATTYDPIESNELNYEIIMIIDEVLKFNEYSYIPVKLKVNGKTVEVNRTVRHVSPYYDPITGIEIQIKKTPVTEVCFRGQSASSNLSYNFLGFVVNILRGSASDILTYNRSEIKATYKAELERESIKAIYNTLRVKFMDMLVDDDMKLRGSMFIEYYKEALVDIDFPFDKYKSYWEDHKVEVDKTAMTLIEILRSDQFAIVVSDKKRDKPYEFTKENSSIVLKIYNQNIASHNPLTQFVFGVLNRFFKTAKLEKTTSTSKGEMIIFNKSGNIYPVDSEQLISLMVAQQGNFNFGCRTFIPCLENYSKLRLRDDTIAPYVPRVNLSRYLKLDFVFPIMLSPYAYLGSFASQKNSWDVRTTDRLFDFVYNNRYDESTSKSEITDSYHAFIEEISPKLGISNNPMV